MKKLTRRGFTAAGILAAMSVAGVGLRRCSPFSPSDNEVVDVYGPPSDYDPSQNEVETVYGPPEWFGLEEEDPYDPDQNELEDVYGPPEDFDDSYEADENVLVGVYGPPEDPSSGIPDAD